MSAAARRRVVLASGNPGKIREFEAMLGGAELVPQSALGIEPPEETGLSFLENALIKARHAAAAAGLPAVADDSGLEVDALGGAPGVRSARYAGVDGPGADAANNRKLLEALAGVPERRRGARFQCVVVFLARPGHPAPRAFRGAWEGRILTREAGEGGFGYDPLFLVPGLGRSAAELDPRTKNALSHRGQALRELSRCWNSLP